MPRNKNYTTIYLKRRIYSLKTAILALFLENLKQRKPKNVTILSAKRMILALGQELSLSATEMNELYAQSYATYMQISKKFFYTRRKLDDETVNAQLYIPIRAMIQGNTLVQETNKVAYDIEYRQKHEYIYGKDGIISSSRRISNYSPFFLASSHPKPAKDHAAYEGKMYYDADWERYAAPHDLDSIRAYINNRKLMSIQEVVAEPIFFSTRRNCKHFFRRIPLEEALTSSPKSLLKRHNMYHKDKDVPATQEELTYRHVYNRNKIEEMVNQIIPNKKLSQDKKRTAAELRRIISVL